MSSGTFLNSPALPDRYCFPERVKFRTRRRGIPSDEWTILTRGSRPEIPCGSLARWSVRIGLAAGAFRDEC
ncbi:hypothetical protein SUDANB96_03202 [Streptomyces sp. enrichment culture]